MIAPLLLYFSNHILVIFVDLFKFSLSVFQFFSIYELKKKLTTVYILFVNSFNNCRIFILLY